MKKDNQIKKGTLKIEDIATAYVLAKEQGVEVHRDGDKLYFVDPAQFYFKPTKRRKSYDKKDMPKL